LGRNTQREDLKRYPGEQNHESKEGGDVPHCRDERYFWEYGRKRMREGQRKSPTNRQRHRLTRPLERPSSERAKKCDGFQELSHSGK
jgi:hypothetical protein